jgi:hypothetical protein
VPKASVMKNDLLLTALLAAIGTAALSGCVYRERAGAPAASPVTTVAAGPAAGQRAVTYPEGRYELRGDGTGSSPYYWVWIPQGATPPDPPPLPRRIRTK